MAEVSNYYKLLQIDPEADPEVITAAYRRLSRKYHPDLNGDARAQQQMLELNRAYEILIDPVQRAQYDRTLKKQLGPVARVATAQENERQVQMRRVLGAPIAAGLPAQLDFGRVRPDRLIRRELQIRNAGGGFLDGVFTSHAEWLRITPTSFKSNAITAEVTVDPRRLPHDQEHNARLDLVYDGIRTSCHVRVVVTRSDWRLWAVIGGTAGGFLVLLLATLMVLIALSNRGG